MFSTFVLEETRSGEDGGLVGCWLLYLFYVLILVLKTYKAMLNRNPNSRHKSEMKRQNLEEKLNPGACEHLIHDKVGKSVGKE